MAYLVYEHPHRNSRDRADLEGFPDLRVIQTFHILFTGDTSLFTLQATLNIHITVIVLWKSLTNFLAGSSSS